MDRKVFIQDLEYLLQDISEEDRKDAILFYENYFDEAGKENESRVINELGEPSRIAAIIKDGLHGQFDERINAGDFGFSDDDYQRNYQVIHSDEMGQKQETHNQGSSHLKQKWIELDSRDKAMLIIIGIIALIPLSFSIFGVFGGLFGLGFSFLSIFFCLIFGFWVITFVLYVIAVIFIVIGVIKLFALPGAGLIFIGIGCILMTIGKCFSKVASWFYRDFIPGIFNAISDGFAKIFHKEAKS